MSTLATRTVAPIVRATSDSLRVALPKPILDAIAAAEKLQATRREDPFTTAGAGLSSAVADALLAGKDPLDSKAVQRAALGMMLSEANMPGRLSGHADQILADAVAKHADEIIETWRPTVQRVSDTLANFRRLAPGADLNDAGIVGRLPAEALTPWGQAKEAVRLLDKVAQGWNAVASAVNLQIPDRGGRLLAFANLSLEQVNQLPSRSKPEALAQFDMALDLADVTTYRERTARLAEQMQEQMRYEAAAPERQREERRRSFGLMVP